MDLRERAAQMYGDGVPVEQITKETGFSHRTLTRIAKEYGVSRNTARGSRPLKRDRNLAQVLDLASQGLTVHEISERLPESVNPMTIGGWLREAGMAAKYSDGHKSPATTRRQGQRERLLALVRSGVPVIEAADEVGTNKTSAYRWVKASGLDLTQTQKHQKARAPERQTQAVDLYNEGVPLDEIRKRMRIDYYVLRELLADAGAIVSDSGAALDGLECPCGNRTGSRSAKYCSPSCRSKYGTKRERDPAKWGEFVCETCDKKFERRLSSGNQNRFCSNRCAAKHTKAVKHYVVREADMVLDSTWEMLFAGLMGFAKVPCRRYDREAGVPWGPDLSRWYAPDFIIVTGIVDREIAVEIKGLEDDEDPGRWAAFREAKPDLSLLVLDRGDLDSLRRCDDPRDWLLETLAWRAP